MSISNDLQTLGLFSSEIDESQVKLTFANQCIKAQEALANKLKEEIRRRKEICYFKKNENQKLKAEIKNAELEIENLSVAHKHIKSANTEIQKELLLTKENKTEILERITKGEKKYEDLWVQCKKKYEKIPLVKELMQDKNKYEELKTNINILEKEAQSLEKAMKEKKEVFDSKDKKQIVQLAEFLVHEVPATIKIIKEKTTTIKILEKELQDIAKEDEAHKRKEREEKAAEKAVSSPQDEGAKCDDKDWSIDGSPMIPKLHLPSADMDVINFKLDINKITLHTSPVKRTMSFTELENNTQKKPKPDENLKDNYLSCYFSKNATDGDDDGGQNSPAENYSTKKLINIIEDIHIDDNETYKLMAQANIDKFHEVDVISASKIAKEFIKSSQALEIEEIKDVNLPNTSQQDVINPPSQFQDLTLDKTDHCVEQGAVVHAHEAIQTDQKLSQTKQGDKKTVTFELPMTAEEEIPPGEATSMSVDITADGSPNETVISQLDLSDVTDDNYIAIKDMILKKKNQLDLSPQFVYAKNLLQKRNDDQIITSKFFETVTQKSTENDDCQAAENFNSGKLKEQNNDNETGGEVIGEQSPTKDNLVSIEVDNAVSSPKDIESEKPVTGLLFSHGPEGIPDCLDISMSTTGYEDGDTDFPTCLDSSLLLSPKADLQMSGNNSEPGSQDLPNFLSGFRKTGMSFFKQQPADPTPDGNKQNQENNFNFNFGSDEKKTRGGLFSFFR